MAFTHLTLTRYTRAQGPPCNDEVLVGIRKNFSVHLLGILMEDPSASLRLIKMKNPKPKTTCAVRVRVVGTISPIT